MKQIVILVFVSLLILSGCAAKEEPERTREPRNLITKDDYKDLEIKPREEKPVEVDYQKEGTYEQNFEPLNQK